MGSDRARVTYDPRQQYRSVVMQQGRVTLEADWNEASQIASEQRRKEILDIVGPCGTPDDGYKVVFPGSPSLPPFDFSISPGVMYVGGLRVFLPSLVDYSNQTDWLDFAGDPDWIDLLTPEQKFPLHEFVYLLLREQEVSAVEDPDLRDIALGGPDTAQRTRLLQRFVRVTSRGSDCASGLASAEAKWAAEGLSFNPHTMRLESSSQLIVGFEDQPSNGPCEPLATGGYIAPDNQLIRVQLTGADETTGKPQFVWGYDDASFLYRIDVDPNNPQNLIFQSAPVDSFHQPAAGQVVEILRGAALQPNGAVIAAHTGFVVTLDQNYRPDTQSVSLPDGVFLPSEYLAAGMSPPSPLYLRVWQEEKIFNAGTAVPLSDTGLTVTIQSTGSFHTGDFWMFAVRPATPRQVYPERYQNDFQPPDGPREWACPLGVIAWERGEGTLAADCRNHFGPLIDQTDNSGCCSISVRPEDLAVTGLQSIVDRVANSIVQLTAVTAGSSGNHIQVSIANINLGAPTPTFDLTLSETDHYSGLTTAAVAQILGGPQGAGTQPGLALVASTANTKVVPLDQQIVFTGGTAGARATAVILDPNNQPLITLQAKSPGADGNLTAAAIALSGVRNVGTFDLDLTWVKTLTGLTAADFLQRIESELSYEVTAAVARSGKPYLPAEGITKLSGGVDNNAASGAVASQASGYIFGKPTAICLQPGSYRLQTPLVIGPEHGRLTMEACGGGATLSVDPQSAAGFYDGVIQLLGAHDFTLRGVTINMPPASSAPQPSLEAKAAAQTDAAVAELVLQFAIGVRIVGCQGITLEDGAFNYPALASTNGALQYWIAIYANGDCSNIRLLDNRFAGPFNALAQPSSALVITAGYLQSASTVLAAASGTPNAVIPSTADGLVFHGNEFTNVLFGVVISVPTGLVKFDSNRVSSAALALIVEPPAPSVAPTSSSIRTNVQTSLALAATLPLPAAFTPTRQVDVTAPATPAAAAPVAAPPAAVPPAAVASVAAAKTTVASAALSSPAVSTLVQNVSQVLSQAITTNAVANIPSILPGSRIHISANDIDVTSVEDAIALSLSGTVDANGNVTELGFVTITGNIMRSQCATPTVDIENVAGVAIAGNVITNSGVVNPAGGPVPTGTSIQILPASTVGAITGNVLLGAPPVLPNRRGGISSPEDSWVTFNETV